MICDASSDDYRALQPLDSFMDEADKSMTHHKAGRHRDHPVLHNPGQEPENCQQLCNVTAIGTKTFTIKTLNPQAGSKWGHSTCFIGKKFELEGKKLDFKQRFQRLG